MTGTAPAAHGSLELDAAGLAVWGERLGASLRAPSLVALAGELGAGKTTLAKAICRGCGVSEAVTSPTFALVHQYRGAATMVFHLDLYRIDTPRDLTNVGWDDILGANAVVVVEWPERAGPALPTPDWTITLAHVAGAADRRKVSW